jgi:eukaryotic-like serine/threonine-protein kinase
MASRKPPGGDSADASFSDWTRSTHRAGADSGSPAVFLEGGFAPGTILAGRYRVVAPLGRGGMGEVYRAEDLKLGQPVALKFVRGELSAERRQRLITEVAIGRQVSHPAVCRLYDIVEVDAHTFLAMEYVDGEDLQSLLARIGRLPPDKSLDIARDLCAGLAAVHEKGIVHRDLKPANVMIDGRGRARITDFGLAVGFQAPGQYGFAGTPAYMCPEQLAGSEVTPRSDLYAFGLILFEMLTGRRFFDARTQEALLAQHGESKGPKLASATRLLDPALERVVLQCLEEDPRSRPPSARAVLALVPGTDPLEAAMAAGETPSPEAVAAAAKIGDLPAAHAWMALVAVLGGLIVAAGLADRTAHLHRGLLPKTPDVLAERAREVLDRLVADRVSMDDAYSFEWDGGYIAQLGAADRSPRWQALEAMPFSPLYFFYRSSPRRMVAANRDAVVRTDDPPFDVSGMAQVVLTPRGQLLSLLAVPPQREAASGDWPEPDWPALLRETALDPSALRTTSPQWASPVDSDRKAAWEGTYGTGPSAVPVRVEAAAYHGRPVWLSIITPWMKASRMEGSRAPASPAPLGDTAVWILALAMPLGGVLLARRNLRLGRGDRKAAVRVAAFVFASYSLARLFRADHTTAFGDELWILIKVFAYPAFWALQVWVLYTALEPYARRRWPHMLISWKRLLSGDWRDPLVGRDVLIGAATGVLMIILYMVGLLAPQWLGRPSAMATPFLAGSTLTFMRQAYFRLFVNQFSAVLFAMVFLFVLTLLRMVLRRDWLAFAAWAAFAAAPIGGEDASLGWITGGLRALMILLVLTRGGLLPLASALFFMFILIEVPITLDVTAWYASRAVPVVVVLVAVAIYGFRTSLGGKPMFGSSLLDD